VRDEKMKIVYDRILNVLREGDIGEDTGGNEGPFETNILFNEISTVPKDTPTTVLNFTNTGHFANADSIGGTGTARSEWRVLINSTLKIRRRMGVVNMNIEIPLHGLLVNTNDTVEVQVEHYEDDTAQDFSCDLRYHR